MNRLARPSGPTRAKLVIVGARPGKHEVGMCPCVHRHPVNIGLVGPSGNLLWKLLSNHGIRRNDCYVTNVRQDYSSTHATPTAAEITEALPALRYELQQTTANLILCLGREALIALSGKESIEHWRGSILESTLLPGRKLLATIHPAFVLRLPERAYILDLDLQRVIEELEYPEIRRPEYHFIINPTYNQCVAALAACGDPIAIDIECFNKDTITCIGVSSASREALCIPFVGPMRMTIEDRMDVVRKLNTILHTHRLIGQNIAFDISILEHNGWEPGVPCADTMLKHHLLWPELGMRQTGDDGLEKFSGSHDLGTLVSLYTKQPYYKHLGHEWRDTEDWQTYWYYNCLDVALTYEINIALNEELQRYNQLQYYQIAVNALIRPVLRMQQSGVLVDTAALQYIRRRLQAECDVLQEHLNRALGIQCNVRSSIDLRYIISNILKIKNTARTKSGGISADKDALLKLAYNSPYADIFKLILDIRERRTILSGFLNLDTNSEGRYTANYKIHGTDSGRLSSTGPSLFEGRRGPQLQNIPKSARHIFIASPGKVLVASDLRRAEAMFVAYDANDRELIELFEDPSRDLYKEVAASVLHISDVAKWQRDIFKQVIHATNYGMRAKRLISLLRIKGIYIEDLDIPGFSRTPMGKADYLINSYLDAHPAIAQWQQRIWDEGKVTRTLHDAFGRRRFFMGRLDESTKRVMLSFRPQSTIVGITNRALIQLSHLGYNIILQVHDNLIIECPESDLVATVVDLEDAIRCPIQMPGGLMVIPTDTTYGNSWGELNGVVAADLLALHRETRSARTIPFLGGHDNTVSNTRT